MNNPYVERSKNKLNRLAWLLDSSIPIPGTQLRFGLDGLIGLIPGIGDTAGAIISSYIIAQASQLGAPKSILIKMAFNVCMDAVLGIVPVLGDLTDFVWKANQRNVQLLSDYLDRPQQTVVHSQLFVGVMVVVVALVVIAVGAFGFLLMRWLWISVQGA